jgi:hypothetical protein
MRHHCAIGILLAALTCLVSTAAAQSAQPDSNPCETGIGSSAASPEPGTMLFTNQSGLVNPPDTNRGLSPADQGLVVYDANQGLCWLADANLAGDPELRDVLNVDGINPDGTMTYAVALKWVNALNHYDKNQGLLGHQNWQLPVTPLFDDTKCSTKNNGDFGVLCSGSALGNLYSVGLNLDFPSSVVPHFDGVVAPFRNLQPGLYWTSDSDSRGETTFSFNTGLSGENTTKYNYFHVLPMTREVLGTPPTGKGVLPYTTGKAAGKAVYDTETKLSWILDANLAAENKFGVSGNSIMGPTLSGTYLSRPRIDVDGSMLFETVGGPIDGPIEGSNGWLTRLNLNEFAGSEKWEVPNVDDLQTLRKHLELAVGDTRLEAHATLGPFSNLQPSFYWSCERDEDGDSQSPCDPKLFPSKSKEGVKYKYSFNFDNGFEGTDLVTKEFYVMVYYPAPGH